MKDKIVSIALAASLVVVSNVNAHPNQTTRLRLYNETIYNVYADIDLCDNNGNCTPQTPVQIAANNNYVDIPTDIKYITWVTDLKNQNGQIIGGPYFIGNGGCNSLPNYNFTLIFQTIGDTIVCIPANGGRHR